MFRFLRSLFLRRRARYFWVWELEETVVRLALFRFEDGTEGACLGFNELRRQRDEERLAFWIRAGSSLTGAMSSMLPRRASHEKIFLLGAGLLRFMGGTFVVERGEPGRELLQEEVASSLLDLLPKVREIMKGAAARQFGLERHEVNVVDGVLEEVLLDGEALKPERARASGDLKETPLRRRKRIGRKLTFRIFLLLSPREVVKDFSAFVRSLSLKEFSLLPLALPAAKLITQNYENVSGLVIFFDEDWAEIAFLREGRLARNTLVSIGVRTIREAIAEVLGLAEEPTSALFSLWVKGELSPAASRRLGALLEPSFGFIHEVLSSALSGDREAGQAERFLGQNGLEKKNVWFLGPGGSIPGLFSYLLAKATLMPSKELNKFLPVTPPELESMKEKTLPLSAAASFFASFREMPLWQEHFIRALRLMQR